MNIASWREKKRRRLVKAHEVRALSGRPAQDEVERTMVENEVGIFLENVGIGSLDPSLNESPLESPHVPMVVPEEADAQRHDQGRTISFSGNSQVVGRMMEMLRRRFSVLMDEGSPSLLENFRKEPLEAQLISVRQEGTWATSRVYILINRLNERERDLALELDAEREKSTEWASKKLRLKVLLTEESIKRLSNTEASLKNLLANREIDLARAAEVQSLQVKEREALLEEHKHLKVLYEKLGADTVKLLEEERRIMLKQLDEYSVFKYDEKYEDGKAGKKRKFSFSDVEDEEEAIEEPDRAPREMPKDNQETLFWGGSSRSGSCIGDCCCCSPGRCGSL